MKRAKKKYSPIRGLQTRLLSESNALNTRRATLELKDGNGDGDGSPRQLSARELLPTHLMCS